jgi:high-affinity iron transporter
MSATLIIVFREILEAALVVGIVLAATRGIAGAPRWISLGILGGVVGAVLVAAFAGAIADAASGIGQELFNATVLFLAVIMLGWHNVWMAREGRAMSQELRALGASVRVAERPIAALALVVGVAVMREGSELVLFLYGIAAAQGSSAPAMLTGGALGLGLGVLAGAGIYFGLLRVAGRYLFMVTSALILFLAAGMAAQGAKFLVQAGYLPPLGARLWDTSSYLPDDSALGTLLHVLAGYVARPEGIQLVFYIGALLIIGGLMYVFRSPRTPAATVALLLAVGIMPATIQDAKAGFKVYAPYVEFHELEIEFRPSRTIDNEASKDNEQKHLVGVGYGVTQWWFTEVYAEWEREAGAGERTKFEAFEWENRFQLSNPGEDWVDFGLLAEFERTDSASSPDKLEFALLFAKSLGKFAATFNLILEREIGTNAGDDLEVGQAFQLKYRLARAFEPGIELHSEFGPFDEVPNFDEQKHFVGPVAQGVIRLGDTGTKLKYNAGYLFGLTDESADGVVKAIIELEFPF